MRFLLVFSLIINFMICTAFQPVKTLNIQRRVEDLDDIQDPFEVQSPSQILSSLNNSTKRLKLEMDTKKYLEKFGPQQLLDLVLRKVHETQSIFNPKAKVAFEQFLDFVENMIYSTAAQRIEKQLKLDFTKTKPPPQKTLHVGEFRRDAPALGEFRQNSVLIDVAADAPLYRQPLEPSKLAYFSTLNSGEELVKVEKKDIRRSPIRKNRKISQAMFEKAMKTIEQDQKRIRRKSLVSKKLRRARKLPISRVNRRRSPVRKAAGLNEKLHQLLGEYGVDSFLIETSEYTVRAFADPRKTRISKLTSTIENENEERKPAFIYSRSVEKPIAKKLLPKSTKTTFERLL
ncbi:unnamed protein product [Caenorhabditis angaria]|uniref:SPK domain-containing protein n=1 Tax=Caenorhabditis angaria TaxID=860376 RepID=A0A9P1IWW1_9PELO|nr:unnamed protein product [Caenorhabditis angaria]